MGMRIHPTESYNSDVLEGMWRPCVTWISRVLGEKNKKLPVVGSFFIVVDNFNMKSPGFFFSFFESWPKNRH